MIVDEFILSKVAKDVRIVIEVYAEISRQFNAKCYVERDINKDIVVMIETLNGVVYGIGVSRYARIDDPNFIHCIVDLTKKLALDKLF